MLETAQIPATRTEEAEIIVTLSFATNGGLRDKKVPLNVLLFKIAS
jgi:hypothetical protein